MLHYDWLVRENTNNTNQDALSFTVEFHWKWDMQVLSTEQFATFNEARLAANRWSRKSNKYGSGKQKFYAEIKEGTKVVGRSF
jgi:hypothetical protein